MSELYKKGRSTQAKTTKQLRRRFAALMIILIMVGALGAIVLYDLKYRNNDSSPQVSKTTVERVSFDGQYHKSDFFQFADDGNWKLATSESTSSKVIFRKYLAQSDLVQHQLVVYINSKPSALELANTRAMPVSVKNSNSFNAGGISVRCGEKYGPSELKQVKELSIAGTTMLCDPDLSRYRVVFGEVGGDYKIRLKRSDGSYANYIIFYQDSRIKPNSEVVDQLAKTFMAL